MGSNNGEFPAARVRRSWWIYLPCYMSQEGGKVTGNFHIYYDRREIKLQQKVQYDFRTRVDEASIEFILYRNAL